jgi:predicted RNase H-like HicB family nuclease
VSISPKNVRTIHHTQAKSLDVLMKRVAEAITLCLADGPRR